MADPIFGILLVTPLLILNRNFNWMADPIFGILLVTPLLITIYRPGSFKVPKGTWTHRKRAFKAKHPQHRRTSDHARSSRSPPRAIGRRPVKRKDSDLATWVV